MLRLNDYKCVACGNTEELLINEDTEEACCPECFGDMDKQMPVFNVNMGVGAHGYYDETLRTYIHTNKQRKEECRKQEVFPQGDTPKNEDAWV